MADRVERLTRELARDMGRCIRDFGLVEEGDRIMVCVSGGKDSYTLLHLLERARRRAPVRFELVAVHLDQGHPGYDGTPLEGWLASRGFDYRIVREDTHAIVTERVPPGKTHCSLCSRLRRGILYNAAEELGCTKIALGHHRDDAVETLLLNLMFAGSLGSMPPKLVAQGGRNTVIRPLLYCSEARIGALAEALAFPILPCDLCGSQPDLWRQQVKRLLDDLEVRIPNVRESMLAAMTHVRPSHLLDAGLWRALGLPAAAEGGEAAEPEEASEEAASGAGCPPRRLPLLS
ncbi:MAG: tRNA 2-thiocytidine(32) synthetase TtcA [Myxococcota bacterium]